MEHRTRLNTMAVFSLTNCLCS